MQSCTDRDAAGDVVYSGQGSHIVMLDVYLPGSQFTQLSGELAICMVEYVPAMQSMHVLAPACGWYFPA